MKTRNAITILHKRFANTPEKRERIDEMSINSQISELIYQVRTNAGLTQQQLAELIDTKQPVIARLEDADYDGHSLKMLQKIAAALGKRIYIAFAEDEVVAEAVSVKTVNHLGQLLHRKFEQWLESGWQTTQSLGIALQLPQFQPVPAVRGEGTPKPSLLKAEILVTENLAINDSNNPLASVRMAKKLDELGIPLGLVVSVSQVSDCEPVNVFFQLQTLNDENLPADIGIRLLDEHGQPESYSNAPDKIMEKRSDGKTSTIYLMFKCLKGARFGLELSWREVKIHEQFFI